MIRLFAGVYLYISTCFDSSSANSSSFHMYSFSGPPMVFSHLPAELLPADQNKFSFFSTCQPYASITSQNIYLDSSELNEILYLGSRDVYLTHI